MSLDVYLYATVDTGGEKPHEVELYTRNITHNVGKMWTKAGVWEALYESHGKIAQDILPALERGVAHMAAHREEYTPLNPPNGWGNYEGALDFLSEYTAECRSNPLAKIGVCR
jgi:hypothetical protein